MILLQTKRPERGPFTVVSGRGKKNIFKYPRITNMISCFLGLLFFIYAPVHPQAKTITLQQLGFANYALQEPVLSAQQSIFLENAGKNLYKQLLKALSLIETYKKYWQSERTKSTATERKKIDHAIKILENEWDFIASYVAKITEQLQGIQTDTKKTNPHAYCTLSFTIVQCLNYAPIQEGAFSLAETAALASYRNKQFTVKNFLPLIKRKITFCKIPPHYIRHWKMYTALGIGCATALIYAYTHPDQTKRVLEKISSAFYANFVKPFKDCWNLFFGDEPSPTFPNFDAPPYLYQEEKEIYYNLHKDYLTLKTHYETSGNTLKKDKGYMDKAISHIPYLGALKDRSSDVGDVINAIYTAMHQEAKKISITPEQAQIIHQKASHAAETAALGPEVSDDMAKAYHNPFLHIIDLDRKTVGLLPRLLGLKIQQINLLLAKLTDDFSKASTYWNHKAVSMWKVLRVVGIFSIIPAALITYKAYKILTKQQCTKSPEIRLLLRSIDKIFLPHSHDCSALTLAEQGSIIFWVDQLNYLINNFVPDHYKKEFLEDVAQLTQTKLSAQHRHEILNQIYQTYAFLKSA